MVKLWQLTEDNNELPSHPSLSISVSVLMMSWKTRLCVASLICLTFAAVTQHSGVLIDIRMNCMFMPHFYFKAETTKAWRDPRSVSKMGHSRYVDRSILPPSGIQSGGTEHVIISFRLLTFFHSKGGKGGKDRMHTVHAHANVMCYFQILLLWHIMMCIVYFTFVLLM